MKTLICAFILLSCAHWLVAAEIPSWHVIKASERGAKMIRIVEAVYEYESKFGKFPPTLYALASKGFLKEEELCLKNSDKSLTVPEYFPDLTAKSRADSVVVRAPSDDRSYEIVVRMDLSISGMGNKKAAEQAGRGDGDKPSN